MNSAPIIIKKTNPGKGQPDELSYGWPSAVPETLSERKDQFQLFETYQRFVLGICMRYTNSIEEAKDFSQEAFIRIFDSLEGKNQHEIQSLKGWIATVTVRAIIDQLRKKKKNLVIGIHTDSDISIQGFSENTALESLSAEEITKLLQQMPEGYRVVFNLYIIEGYSHHEISQMLNISESTSRSQLVRAKEWLKTKIKK